MNGLEIIAKEVQEISQDTTNYGLFILIILCIIILCTFLGFIIGCVIYKISEFKNTSAKSNGAGLGVVIGLFITIILLIGYQKIEVIGYQNYYYANIYEDVSMFEFTEKYEIVKEIDENFYYIREKEIEPIN